MLVSESEKLMFSHVYSELKLACYQVALSVTKNKNMAEDVVQNAFLAVIKHKDEIFVLPAEKRRAKILHITKNKAIDLMRFENRRAHDPLDETQGVSDFSDITAEYIHREALDFLINCIESLPEKYKTVFELRYVHDMSNLEISALLGITNKAVSTRISRAKTILQEQYEQKMKIINGRNKNAY